MRARGRRISKGEERACNSERNEREACDHSGCGPGGSGVCGGMIGALGGGSSGVLADNAEEEGGVVGGENDWIGVGAGVGID